MGCCQVVGDLTGDTGYISINTSCSVEGAVEDPICGSKEPDIILQTVTVTGYASNSIHVGCPGRAGVSTTLTRRYNYDSGEMVFICNGQGASYVVGDVGGLASITEPRSSCDGLSASASSGPTSIYIEATHNTGFGLNYTGNPISFSTTKDSCTMMSPGFGYGSLYLQSFSLDAQSGQIPVASYTLTGAYRDK